MADGPTIAQLHISTAPMHQGNHLFLKAFEFLRKLAALNHKRQIHRNWIFEPFLFAEAPYPENPICVFEIYRLM